MANYGIAFAFMMDNEDRLRAGRWTKDPSAKHPDAIARFGINSGAHPEAVSEGFYMMDHDAALQWAAEFYKYRYFALICGYSIACQDIANKFFDMAVNEGAQQATKIIQRALNKVLSGQPGFEPLGVDGRCGPHTTEAINRASPEELLPMIKFYAIDFYKAVAFRLQWPDPKLQALIVRVNR